ncbi:c-type cytochrome [Luteolibacter luteus]|uniref:C-type cytochrome n=1 Tax=Luteolibacter luteus TaxID=2728835 RepID=A0A858RK49_9BACT|nr:c-type cytochrome [Luteolibacter luteus]QJE97307.1 c-type cytochrome [Luteolibacter luteus]
MAAICAVFTLQAAELPANEPVAHWLWKSATPSSGEKVYFRREFELPQDIASAAITVACDDWHRIWFNGKELGFAGDWTNSRGYDVVAHLKQGGRNVIAVEGRNEQGAAAMALRFRATLKDGRKLYVMSDGNWSCNTEAPENWPSPDFSDDAWPKAEVVGKMGDAPWGTLIAPEGHGPAAPEDVTSKYQVAAGFKLERLYRVPKDQGSWVAMTVDGKGQLLCADQYGKIYRVNPSKDAFGSTSAEPTNIPLSGAHGLLWHQGVLYVTVNEGTDQSGVWRVTDTNGDGEPDKPELLKAFTGRGEHGPHGLAVSPDGQWIYCVLGNHTDYTPMDSSLVSLKWGEDQLLPRRPDARGHARDRFAPGGYIVRFKPDNSHWQLFSIGYRNQYDLAFNQQGDLFTYDSDMEWDLGMPWYRPTRICHVVPGSEFGWRNGSGVWPEYYEDSMGTQLDIGPGCPTGVLSGKGAKFPAKYQQAIYALDWTYATIHAIHLVPHGGGYKAEREEFIAGSGLPLTDAVIGPDGAMYFLTGGRRTDSALWRVTYGGGDKVDPVEFASKTLELEDRAKAWEALGSNERIVRYKAHVALEAGDPAEVAAELATENDPWRIIGGAMVLARTGGPEHRGTILEALGRLDESKTDLQQKLNALRACGLVFIRHGEPAPQEREGLLARLNGAFPTGEPVLDHELCRMLCYLQAPGIVGRTLALMDASGPTPVPDWLSLAKRNADYGKVVEEMIANLPPAEVIHYIYCLRVVKGPWEQEERKRFFAWFEKLLSKKGGASYAGFIEDLKKETLATATPEEREWIAKLATAPATNALADLPKAQGPGREWTIDEVVKLADEGLTGRNKENGRKMFQASLCVACHRFGAEGGATGPDLSALGGRFNVRDLAEAILDPSKVVSDQYAFDLITKTDGSQVTGKLLDEKDDHWIIATSPFDFSQTVEIERNQIKDKRLSPVSPMPPGLINSLNPDELKDLLAYILGK